MYNKSVMATGVPLLAKKLAFFQPLPGRGLEEIHTEKKRRQKNEKQKTQSPVFTRR
jgi:hypothetical protein